MRENKSLFIDDPAEVLKRLKQDEYCTDNFKMDRIVSLCWNDKSAEDAENILNKLKDTGLVKSVSLIVTFDHDNFIIATDTKK